MPGDVERMLAFAMSRHARLGQAAQAWFKLLPEELLRYNLLLGNMMPATISKQQLLEIVMNFRENTGG